VILVAWLPNFLVAALASSVRFSLGWYAARGFALVASFMLLSVLLTEMTVLYSRLANAFSLLRRERASQLMSVDAATAAIAHEVRSPLSAITLNASTAALLLQSNSPSLEQVREIFHDIEVDSLRVSQIISSIRSLFKTTGDNRVPARLGDIAQKALLLSNPDILVSQVSVLTDFQDSQYQVCVDQVQMQQVVLNLIRNAIEAMTEAPPGGRDLKLATKQGPGSTVLLSIEDTGPGVQADSEQRIFDAFFTTKRSGLGLGLAISRTIVESHGGKLRLARSGPSGATFEVSLKAATKPQFM
jgi:signal transduction histidine kinase